MSLAADAVQGGHGHAHEDLSPESELLAARYRALVEQIPAITYTQVEDPDSPTGFRDVYISPQTFDILGYTPEEWQADPELWIYATHPDDRARVVAEDIEAAATRGVFRTEYRMIARDGRIVWFRDEARLVQDENGTGIWQGVMLDVTAQKESEQTNLETQAKYRALVEQIPAIVYLGEFGPQGEWLYISPQIEHVLGYTPEEWLRHPHPLASFTHPDDLPAVRAEEERAQREGDAFRAEYRMLTKDGLWRWILDEAHVVRGLDDTPLYMQGLMYDTTERKAVEEALKSALVREQAATEQLRKLDGIKATLLRVISHDLKAPLTAVLGASATLSRLNETLSKLDRDSLLHTISDRAKKMEQVLSDLVDMERLEQGVVEPKRFPTDIGRLVRHIATDEFLTGEREIVVEAAKDLMIAVDASKVERMVENLITNAVRHTPRDSRVWVKVEPHEGGALMSVEDEGRGVPDDLKEAVFQPFTRAPGTSAPGTGIGLSIVGRFAEMHGGKAWVEDRPGGGASFRIYLPAA